MTAYYPRNYNPEDLEPGKVVTVHLAPGLRKHMVVEKGPRDGPLGFRTLELRVQGDPGLSYLFAFIADRHWMLYAEFLGTSKEIVHVGQVPNVQARIDPYVESEPTEASPEETAKETKGKEEA